MYNIFDEALSLLETIKQEKDEPIKLRLKLEFMYLSLNEPEFTVSHILDLLNNNFKNFLILISLYNMLKSIQNKMIKKYEEIEKLPPVNEWFISFNKGICMWSGNYINYYMYNNDTIYILIYHNGRYDIYYSIENDNYNYINNNELDIADFEEFNIYPPVLNGKKLEIIPKLNEWNIRDINFYAI